MKILYKTLVLFLLFSTITTHLYAQSGSISGSVLDANKEPMAFVTVQLEGTNKGAISDINGKYTIDNLNAGTYTLTSTYLGYKKFSQQVTVNNTGVNVDINLEKETSSLKEVVVIGYGTTEKKDLTGSIVSVSSKDFLAGNITTPDQLITGKVAGVQITPNGGSPGSGSTIRIRGGSSLNASNDPLFVIDGVPVDNGGIGGSPNPLSLINPNDIENITILKDASATAIYGSRASNGVIIITTKKAARGKLKIEFNTVQSFSQVSKYVDVLTADEFRNYIRTFETDSNKLKLMGDANTNWQKEIYRNAFSSDNLISLQGGIKALPYRLSLGFLNQNGVLITDNMQRSTINLNLTPSFFDDHLKLNINQKTSFSATNFANQGAIGAATYFDPTQPVTVESERFGGYFEWLNGNVPNALATRNPVGMINMRSDVGNVQRHLGNIQIDYKTHFLPELRANLNLGYDIAKSNGEVIVEDSAATNYTTKNKGFYSEYEQYKRNTLFEFYLNYKKELKSIKSIVDFVAGHSYQDWYFESPNLLQYDGAGDTLSALPAFPFNKAQNTLISFYGRLNYTLNEKYLLTLTLRNDGSSRFAEDERWGLFPSAAFAWRIGDEGIFKRIKALSDLKLRLGYGETGQQDVGANFNYLPVYTQSDDGASYQFGNQFYYTLRPSVYDPTFRWESTTTYNAGLDYGFFNGRISGSVDFYYKKTVDLIAEIGIPAGTNFKNRVLTNVGSIENRGIEFMINTVPISKKDITLEVGFNVTANRNNILSLSKVANDTSIGNQIGGISGGVGNTIQINSVGNPINTFFVYKQKYDESGNPIEGEYEDLNGDGTINSEDLYRFKSSNPDLFLGFTAQLTYKKWSFGFLARAVIGNYVYNNTASFTAVQNAMVPAPPYLSNATSNVLETNFAQPQYFSDYYVQNASFVRFDNINIGYNFGKVFNGLANIRAFANIQNAFVITKYTGLDPEVFNGIDNNLYPRPRIFSLGFNVQL
jgi:iron complex outermembrane receptor protein